MRPKKRCVLYCADPLIGSEIGFLLALRCHIYVSVVGCAAEMEELLGDGVRQDVVVAYRSILGQHPHSRRNMGADEEVFELLRRAKPADVPLVEVAGVSHARPHSVAEIHVCGSMPPSSAEVIEGVRRGLARKRGPKKVGMAIFADRAMVSA